MQFVYKTFIVLALYLGAIQVSAQVRLTDASSKTAFILTDASSVSAVCYDSHDPIVTQKVSQLFADDVKRVTGKQLAVIDLAKGKPSTSRAVIVGTVKDNALIAKLVKKGQVDTTGMGNGWEQYAIQRVKSPGAGIKDAIVIAGCDRRGAAYGLLAISRAIGVSPWYWWADAPITHRNSLAISVSQMVSKRPTVKYRGIFINDEDWGLFQWAKLNYDKSFGNIGPRTYAKVCELLLRLNANHLYPAMHNCSLAFHKVNENRLVADSFGIVMGASHCEPLLLNTATEWDSKKYGEWDYEANKKGVDNVLKARAIEAASYENVWPLALRGLHDKAMNASNDMEDRMHVMQEALLAQRHILEEVTGKKGEDIPQAFTPYKEVLDVYDQGLKLPDDITIIWPDDNYGYMKRLSSPKEQARTGRSGVYYHSSYLGRPHDYLWMNTTSPTFMYEELRKAYDMTADRIWILNAGDIKSCEFAVDFFLTMAYDIDSFNYDRAAHYRTEWLCNMLGTQYQKEFDNIVQPFYDLAFQRKPECMGWGYQWTSDARGREQNTDTEFSFTNYREADRRIAAYKDIANKAYRLMKQMPTDKKACFFETLYYPVKGCELMNRTILEGQRNRWYAFQNRAASSEAAATSKACYDSLAALTKTYNTMLKGKWNHVIAVRQEGASAYFERPILRQATLTNGTSMGILAEGEDVLHGNTIIHALPTFNVYLPASHYFDIFSKGTHALSWTATASAPWIKLSQHSGKTTTENRIEVSIDWAKAPKGERNSGKVRITTADGERDSVLVSVFYPASPTRQEVQGLYMENNGYISIDAAGFTTKKENADIKIRVIPNLGAEGQSVQLGDPKAPIQFTNRRSAPYVAYDFYTFEQGMVDVYTYVLPTFTPCKDRGYAGHERTNIETHYGVCIDNGAILESSTSSFEYAQDWYRSVLRNCRINKTTLYVDKPGKHTLRIIGGDAGTILQKIVIDLGGMKRSYMGPQPTKVM